MENALRAYVCAWKFFEKVAPSFQHAYSGSIDSAKREETKVRRPREAVRLLADGEKPGLK